MQQDLRNVPETGLRARDRLLSIADIADMCQVSERTVYNYLRRGLTPIRIGRSVRFRRADVLAYLSRQPEG